MFQQLRAYYQLTKPGIIRGNAVHVLAGALFASVGGFMWTELLGVIIGTSLVIASACVANNYMDRGIDARMKRTKMRPSVTGVVSVRNAMIFTLALIIAGLTFLYYTTNVLVIAIGLLAYVLYVFVYGYAKRRTVHSTLIGAIPGALPAMAGYVAIDGQLSVGALLVFLLIFAWQMPHFYAISMFRRNEYESARLPVMAVVKPSKTVRQYILAYIVVYVVVVTLLIATATISPPAGLLLLAGSAYWVVVYFGKADDKRWARSVFGASLLLTLLLVVAAGLNLFVTSSL